MNTRGRAALIAVAALLVGMYLGGHPGGLPALLRDGLVGPQARTSANALQVIEDNYFRKVSANQLQDESVRGMVASLRQRYQDRFSHYYDPMQFAQFEQVTGGQFSGVGLGVDHASGGLKVTAVFAGSPAARAGIRRGDVITAANGRSLARLDVTQAVAQIKGPPGTQVRLGVKPASGAAPHELTLRRETINYPVVDGRLIHVQGRPLAYVRMISFTPGVHAKLRQQIETLDREGARGLILDLRGNGGGLLEEAVLSASVFVDRGVIVTTSGRAQEKHVYDAVGGALRPRPTVVLIDHNTASAAEILAAAMEEHGLATVVGQTSFGKGVFQQVIPLAGGSGLDLTVGEYFTSNGTSLAGRGITPQVQAVDNPRTRKDEALARARTVLGAKLGR